jgi:hypothetical protein
MEKHYGYAPTLASLGVIKKEAAILWTIKTKQISKEA